MKKSNMLGMLSLMYAATASPHLENTSEFRPKKNKKLKKIIPKGLKEFFYGENSLYALNQKNADRKARKKGYL